MKLTDSRPFRLLTPFDTPEVSIKAMITPVVSTKDVSRQHFHPSTTKTTLPSQALTDPKILPYLVGFSGEQPALHPRQRTFCLAQHCLLTYIFWCPPSTSSERAPSTKGMIRSRHCRSQNSGGIQCCINPQPFVMVSFSPLESREGHAARLYHPLDVM